MSYLVAGTFGGGGEAPTPADAFTAGDFYGNFLQVIVVLAVIVGLIVVLIRFLAQRSKRWSGERSLQVHAGVPLGQNKSMQVVEIGSAVYIVGVGDDVTLLDKIDDPDRAAALIAALEAKPASAAQGAASVVSFIRGLRRGGQPPEEQEWQSNQEAFRELLAQKLNRNGAKKDAASRSWSEDEER